MEVPSVEYVRRRCQEYAQRRSGVQAEAQDCEDENFVETVTEPVHGPSQGSAGQSWEGADKPASAMKRCRSAPEASPDTLSVSAILAAQVPQIRKELGFETLRVEALHHCDAFTFTERSERLERWRGAVRLHAELHQLSWKDAETLLRTALPEPGAQTQLARTAAGAPAAAGMRRPSSCVSGRCTHRVQNGRISTR